MKHLLESALTFGYRHG